jgi:hypothetical protein
VNSFKLSKINVVPFKKGMLSELMGLFGKFQSLIITFLYQLTCEGMKDEYKIT